MAQKILHGKFAVPRPARLIKVGDKVFLSSYFLSSSNEWFTITSISNVSGMVVLNFTERGYSRSAYLQPDTERYIAVGDE